VFLQCENDADFAGSIHEAIKIKSITHVKSWFPFDTLISGLGSLEV